MKYFDWSEERNRWLQKERGISFEFIKECIENGQVVGSIPNHPPYAHQKVFLILIEEYVYEVPYVEEGDTTFFKTAYPSHEETKRFRRNNKN